MLLSPSFVFAGKNSQPPPPDVLTSSQVSRDIEMLSAALNEGSPSLDRYVDAARVDGLLSSMKQLAATPSSPVDLWRALAPRLGEFRDGHLTVLPSPGIYAAYFSSPGHLLPFKVEESDGRLWILRAELPESPEQGSEILSIKGVPARDLLVLLENYVAADGAVLSRKPAVVERDFDLLCALHFGFPGRLRFEVRLPNGEERAIHVETVPYARLAKARQVGPPSGSSTSLILLEPRTALMRVGSFAKDAKPDLPGFLKESFARLRKEDVAHLIIDLRGNPGGRDSHGALLYAHLATGPFKWVESRRIRKRDYDFVRGTPERWLNLQLRFVGKREAPGGGYLLDEDLDHLQQPREPVFTGAVSVLADGATFSTASEFVSIFKSNRRGRIVGSETGNAYGGDSGATVGLALPESGLIVNVPLVRYDLAVSPVQPLNRGVLPDIEVRPTFEDRRAGRDPVLGAAIDHH